MNKRITVLLCYLFLVACSQTPDVHQLKDLSRLEPKALSKSSKKIHINYDEMIRRYQAILDIHDDPTVITQVKRRIADLELMAMEKRQFSDNTVEGDASDIHYKEVIQHYLDLLKNNPQAKANENTLYQLAKAYDYQGQSKESLTMLNQLIHQFPNTQHYDEVQFRRGDIYYSLKAYANAEKSYAHLIVNNDDAQQTSTIKGPYYLNALYMQGWVLFKQARYEESSLLFSQVLDLTLDKKEIAHVKPQKKAIVDDSLRILSIIFSYQSYGQSIAKLYQENGQRPYEPLLYLQLSDLLLTRGLHIQAIDTNKTFISHYPLHEQTPNFFKKNIDILQQQKQILEYHAEKDAYIKRFGLASAYWLQSSVKQQGELKKQLHSYLLEMASFHHAFAQTLIKQQAADREKINTSLAQAISHYQQWLLLFPQDSTHAEKSFLLAQAYQENMQFDNAIIWYEKTAFNYSPHPRAEHSAYSICLNYQQQLAQWPKSKINSSQYRHTQLLKIHAQLRFNDYYPQSAYNDALNINTLESLYQLQDYASSSAQAELLLENTEKLSMDQRYRVLIILGHSQFLQQDFYTAEQSYLQALRLSAHSTASHKDKKILQQRIAHSIYQQAEHALEQDQMTFALLHFHRMAYATQVKEYLIKAHYDEATYLLIAKRWPEAIDSLLSFRQKYPTHEFSTHISSKLIASYEGKNAWLQAAKELDNVRKLENDTEKKRLALFLSAQYYEKAQHYDDALKNYRSYAHQFPQPFDLNLETRFKLSEMYKQKNNSPKREYWLKSLIATEKEHSNVRSRFLGAMASQYFAEKSYINFSKITLNQPLEKSLSKKQLAFEAQLQAYKKVDAYGVSLYSSYARFSIANMYATLAHELLNSQTPKGFNALELEEYQYMLEDEIAPFEENAIALHTSNTTLTQQNIYNDWVEKSFQALITLFPARFHRPERMTIDYERIY